MRTLPTHRQFLILALPVLVVVALAEAAFCGTQFESTLDGASNVPPQPVPGGDQALFFAKWSGW